MKNNEVDSNNLVQSVIRALDIINLLANNKNGLTVTEISKQINLHTSTVYRLLNTLRYKDYIKKDFNKYYKTSNKLIEVGSKALDNIDIRRELKPYLKELCEKTNETIHLGVLDNYQIVYLDKEETSHTIRMFSSIGIHGPLYCTGVGKALLAFSDEEYIKDYLDDVELKRYTENTITDKDKLYKHLKKIKSQGFSIDNMEHENYIRCIGAPIFDHQNSVKAAFSISAPTQRMTMKKTFEFKSIVLKYSKIMSQVIGQNTNT